MDDYDDCLSKMALVMTAAQLAKSNTVKEDGIGEDLSMNFFGWVDDHLAIVCQMKRELMSLSTDKRLHIAAELCSVLRRYWGVDSLAMVAEGYCSANQTRTKDMELSMAFLDPNIGVKECITVSHAGVEIDGRAPSYVSMVAIPYSYGLNKSINWSEILVYPNGPDAQLRNGLYPRMLQSVLAEKVIEDLPKESYDELRMLIKHNGFYIQEFD